jgi:hypothetical protein
MLVSQAYKRIERLENQFLRDMEVTRRRIKRGMEESGILNYSKSFLHKETPQL